MFRKAVVSVLAVLAMVPCTLATLVLSGCGEEGRVVEPVVTVQPADSPSEARSTTGPPEPLAQYWGDRIQSEAFYALDQSRRGTSSSVYQGYAMSDWNYVESDSNADKRVAYYVGGCGNRGDAGGVTMMGGVPCHRGGFCFYFAQLILYRSSYGWGGGQHLVLPRSLQGTYDLGVDVHNAQVGWVLQKTPTSPHTAIVVAVYSYGLDVVDANYVGSYYDSERHVWVYRFLIARHLFTWSQLGGYRAVNPWANPTLIYDDPTQYSRCF